MMLTPRMSLLALLLVPASIQALILDCSNIRASEHTFNLKELGGPKIVHYQEFRSPPPTTINTTFTLNICKPLTDPDSKKDEKCPGGTRVCAKRRQYREGQDPYLESVITIAGEFTSSAGPKRALDPTFTRLKGSAGNSDGKEGLIMELHGGKFPDTSSGRKQKAVIEFLCDPKLSGNEGQGQKAQGFSDEIMTDGGQYGSVQARADDDKDKDGDSPQFPDLDKGKSLKFISYDVEDDDQVLRLQWKTKYACENAADNGGDDKTGGWGFFTWLIIIVFLLAAAYIIFGSWLNYNRYGARGWDLIPHGDTIRDIPYIIKDWSSGFGDRLKGQNSRGGYSAV